MDRGAWWASVHAVPKRHNLITKQQNIILHYITVYYINHGTIEVL